jgi:hypothetical protein
MKMGFAFFMAALLFAGCFDCAEAISPYRSLIGSQDLDPHIVQTNGHPAAVVAVLRANMLQIA